MLHVPEESRGRGCSSSCEAERQEEGDVLCQDLETQPQSEGKAGPDVGHGERACPEPAQGDPKSKMDHQIPRYRIRKSK